MSSTIWLMALKPCTKWCSFVPGFCMGRTGVSHGDWQGQINWNLREMIVRGFIPSLACLFKGYCFKFAALAPGQSWLPSLLPLCTHQHKYLFLHFVEFLQGLLVEACLPTVIVQLGGCKLAFFWWLSHLILLVYLTYKGVEHSGKCRKLCFKYFFPQLYHSEVEKQEDTYTNPLSWPWASRPVGNCLRAYYPAWRKVSLGWIEYLLGYEGASLVAQTVKNMPAMQETWIWSLGREDLLEKGMVTHPRILDWRISWTEEPGGLQSMGSQRVRHDSN